MSRVFLSTETALDRRVVLKIPPDFASGVSVDRFKREISLAARLQHAHIVPLLSAGDANGLTPSARATFSTVAKLGFPSALSALYGLSRLIPASLATYVIPRARVACGSSCQVLLVSF